MYNLKHREAEYILNLANVKRHCKEYRLKGFAFDFDWYYDDECVTLRGKIPYSLAQKFYDKFDPKFSLIKTAREQVASEIVSTERLTKGYSDEVKKTAKQIADALPVEELYLTSIVLNIAEELRCIIEIIRENSYVNEWAYGND